MKDEIRVSCFKISVKTTKSSWSLMLNWPFLKTFSHSNYSITNIFFSLFYFSFFTTQWLRLLHILGKDRIFEIVFEIFFAGITRWVLNLEMLDLVSSSEAKMKKNIFGISKTGWAEAGGWEIEGYNSNKKTSVKNNLCSIIFGCL